MKPPQHDDCASESSINLRGASGSDTSRPISSDVRAEEAMNKAEHVIARLGRFWAGAGLTL